MSAAGAARDFDYLIVGAGVIGTTMAGTLLARRLAAPGRVAIIAAGPTPAFGISEAEWDLRVFALSRASQRLLKICGTWPLLPPQRRSAYERMRVWDGRGEPRGRGSLLFDSAELGEPNLGFIVEGRALQAASAAAAAAAGAVFIESGVGDVRVDDAGVRVTLKDGRSTSGRLLIAADGVESATRELLHMGVAGHAYEQDALVAHVRTSQPHENTAWQKFLASGPLAFLPLPDGRSSIVWSTARDEAARLRGLAAPDFGAALTAASGGALGACELTTAVRSFPLRLQYAVRYAAPRAVLIGDAAHVIHPMAGQGLNLGLLDCASLAEELESASKGAVFTGEQRVLRRYERRRRADNLLMATTLDGLDRLFVSANPAVARLRMLGLDAVGKTAFLKRRFAERALGSGDLPAFLKGDPATWNDAA